MSQKLRYSRGQRTGPDSNIDQQDERARSRREGGLAQRLVATFPRGAPSGKAWSEHKASPWEAVFCDTSTESYQVQLPRAQINDAIEITVTVATNAPVGSVTVQPWEGETINGAADATVLGPWTTARFLASARNKGWAVI
jgi:hypothetical protein